MFASDASVQKQLDKDVFMHDSRDRYMDIGVFKKSAVKLIYKTEEEWSDYINACYTNSPLTAGSDKGDGKIIMSQGPLPNTVEHFWQMLIE